jgi:hypothetical protein
MGSGTTKHDLPYRVTYVPRDQNTAPQSAARCGDLTQALATVENLRGVMPGKFKVQKLVGKNWLDVSEEQ